MALTAAQLAKGLYATIEKEPKHHRKVVSAFITMVEEQGLLSLLPHVVKYLEYFKRLDNERTQVRVTLAQKHGSDVIKAITKKMEVDKNTEVVVEVDERIGGGFIAQHNNVIYDGSVKQQLEKVASVLIKQ